MIQVPLALKPSLLILILANIFPLLGAIFWHWKVFDIIFLFWFENLIIGFFNIMRMLAFDVRNISSWLAKLFFIPFFTFHYGMFTAVHGVFVIALFAQDRINLSGLPTPGMVAEILSMNNLGLAALLIFGSHGFSYIWNYIGKKEYRQASVKQLMFRPYGRIVILHLVIILSGFLVLAFKQNIFAIVLLVVLKILVDSVSHLRDHRKSVKTPNRLVDGAKQRSD